MSIQKNSLISATTIEDWRRELFTNWVAKAFAVEGVAAGCKVQHAGCMWQDSIWHSWTHQDGSYSMVPSSSSEFSEAVWVWLKYVTILTKNSLSWKWGALNFNIFNSKDCHHFPIDYKLCIYFQSDPKSKIHGINPYLLNAGWWFGTFFPFIGNFIIPIDELIFFTGLGIPPTRYIIH